MAKKQKRKVGSLERALDFLSLAFKAGDTQSMYCNMDLGFATAFNMIVAVGTAIEEDLCACPHVGLLLAAIARCGEQYSITQLSTQKLLIRSGDFHAYIPCIDPSTLSWTAPDALAAPLDDRFMEALTKVADLAVAKSESVLECSIQLNNCSVIATNRRVIMEAWHGLSFPDGLLIPKVAFTKLNKIKKHMKGFGFSANSVTFYFDDGTWLLSRLFQDKWPPAVQSHLQHDIAAYPIEESFFVAARKVFPFSSTSRIYVEGNLVSSHPFHVKEEGSGLALAFEGARFEPRSYFGDDLIFVSEFALKWDANARPDGTMFFGDNLRGLIHHDHFRNTGDAPSDDEDIPF